VQFTKTKNSNCLLAKVDCIKLEVERLKFWPKKCSSNRDKN